MDKGLKLSINLEMPEEPEYRPDIFERVGDCMERVEYGDDPGAYRYLQKVNACAVKCHKAGQRSDKLHKLLGMLTPFLARYGLEDWRGMDLVEEYVTNPDYKEDCDE